MDSVNISIIIPFYNVEKYIAECIISIMAQTLQDGMECILVDDCSTDRSVQIAESLIGSYKGKIAFRIIKHQTNQGVSCARNTGIKASRGKYIGFVDSDDYIEPSMYKVLQELLENNPNAPFVACPVYVENKGTTSFYRGYELYQKNKMLSIDDFFPLFLTHEIDNFLWNKLFQRSFFVTLFKENRIEEDFLFFYQNCKPILTQNKVVVLSAVPLYHYRTRKDSICNQPRTSVKPLFLDQLVNYREIMSEQEELGNEELCKELYKQLVYLLCHNFRNVLYNRRFLECRPKDMERFWDDVRRVPFSMVPNDCISIKKYLFVVKYVPFGIQILYVLRSLLSTVKASLHVGYKTVINLWRRQTTNRQSSHL